MRSHEPKERPHGQRARRNFPGPSTAGGPLRVAFARRAYADLVAHAKESVDAEVCGVLAGEVCQDDRGPFVDVRAIVRGEAAREGRAQVTFTHETWNRIHATMDKEHPRLQIVGWYHTHPGFGVEFSAMDRFIQENFFSGETQVAFLTDPLRGDTAIACNGPNGMEYLDAFWVDGREHAARTTAAAPKDDVPTGVVAPSGGGGELRREIERLERRIGQLTEAVEEQRVNFYRMLTTVVVVVCSSIVFAVGYWVWSDRYDRIKPPQTNGYIQVPVKIGDDVVMVGLDVVRWDVPPRLNALLDKAVKAEAEEKTRLYLELYRQMQEQQKSKKRSTP
jgi:proteasome lid subunit RPN8/RPN11